MRLSGTAPDGRSLEDIPALRHTCGPRPTRSGDPVVIAQARAAGGRAVTFGGTRCEVGAGYLGAARSLSMSWTYAALGGLGPRPGLRRAGVAPGASRGPAPESGSEPGEARLAACGKGNGRRRARSVRRLERPEQTRQLVCGDGVWKDVTGPLRLLAGHRGRRTHHRCLRRHKDLHLHRCTRGLLRRRLHGHLGRAVRRHVRERPGVRPGDEHRSDRHAQPRHQLRVLQGPGAVRSAVDRPSTTGG